MNSAFRGKALSLLNLHLAGVAALLLLNLFLGVRLFLAWRASGADREEQINQEQITYAQLQSQGRRLAGLPHKVDQARDETAEFYSDRIPPNYSSIAARLGELYVHNGVRWTRASYTQAPAIADLAEIRIDATVSGEYTNVMRFINAVERDKTFFIINAVTFTGQQGGQVNLRLRMTTFLHGAGATTIPALDETSTRPTIEAVR